MNALSKFAQEQRESWDEQLVKVIYSYNTAATWCTPFEVIFGRKANLPIDFMLLPPSPGSLGTQSRVPGPWVAGPGSSGPWVPGPGSSGPLFIVSQRGHYKQWTQVPGSLGPRPGSLIPGPWVPSPWSQVPGSPVPGPRVHCL